MTTLGALLAGLLLLLLLLGVLAWMQRRPRRGPEQPRTVADLVRMREATRPYPAESAAPSEPAAATDDEPQPVEARPGPVADGDPSEVVGSQGADEAPRHVDARPEDRPGAAARVAPVVGATPEDATVDMPWARAARMVEPYPAGAASASDPARDAAPAVDRPRPGRTLLSSDKVDARSRRASYWAARTKSGQHPSTPVAASVIAPAKSAPGLQAGAADPGDSLTDAAASPAKSANRPATPADPAEIVEPLPERADSLVEPAELADSRAASTEIVHPPVEPVDPVAASAETVYSPAEAPGSPAVPLGSCAEPADSQVDPPATPAEVVDLPDARADSSAGPVDSRATPADHPVAGQAADVVDPQAELVDPPTETDRTEAAIEGPAEGAVTPPLDDPRPAHAVASAEIGSADRERDTGAPLPTNGHGPVPNPARVAGRVRRPPSATPAEQAAADLALLRTFGVASRNGTADEPEVELEGCTPDDDEPVAGNAQPIAFRVLARDGRGIPGATVTLLDDHGRETASTRTRSDGHGVLTAGHPGGYMLVTVADGYQPGAITVAVTDAPVDAEIPLTRSASISGSVGGEDGPIVGAQLALVQDGEIVDTTESASDGAYRFADLAAGEYGLSVVAYECEAAAFVLELADEAELRRDVDLVPAGLPSDDVMTAPR